MKAFVFLLLASILCGAGPLSSDDLTGLQIKENKAMLDEQKSGDENLRKDILQKLDGFLRNINGITEKKNGVKLTSPIPAGEISGIEPISHFHSDEQAPAVPLEAFITGSGVRMRSSGSSSSKIIARLDFGEKIVLLAKSDNEELLNGRSYPWILARKKDGVGGWVFGAYIGKNDPAVRADEKKPGAPESLNGFDLPSAGIVTSAFGYRVDPVTGKKGAFHSGIDIAAPSGTPARAAAEGTVTECGFYRNGYGNLVVIRHAGDLYTYYGHLSVISVKKGDSIRRGEPLGKVGASGRATGTHLHFEVRNGAGALNPEPYLR